MSRWPTAPLGSLVKVKGGGTPSRADPLNWQGDIPWVSPKDMKAARLSDAEEHVAAHVVEKGRLDLLPRGSVLVVVRGMILARAVPVAIADTSLTINQDMKALACNGQLASDYLLSVLRGAETKLLQRVSTAAHGTRKLDTKVLLSFPIPLPPLDEQRRIVDLLERAAGIRRLREQALAKARAIVPALFLDMFGDPASNPKGWPVGTLGKMCYLHGGSTLPAALPFMGAPGGTLIVKVGDLNTPENRVEIVQAREWVPADLTGEQVCPAGAVVFPKRGAAISTNKKRLTARRAALDPNLMGVSPRQDDLSISFLHIWFELFDLSSIQSGTTVPQLNKKDLAPLAIAVPPSSVQRTFADRLADLRSIIAQQERSLAAARELERSLMARLLG